VPAKRALGPSSSESIIGSSTHVEHVLSQTKKYRKFSAQQKTEVVLASLRGNKTMTVLCREHNVADSLLRKWRDESLRLRWRLDLLRGSS